MTNERREEVKRYYQIGKQLSALTGISSLSELKTFVKIIDNNSKSCYKGFDYAVLLYLIIDATKKHSSPLYDSIRTTLVNREKAGVLKSLDDAVNDYMSNHPELEPDFPIIRKIIYKIYLDVKKGL